MTSRLLPRDEWPKLAGTLLESVWPSLPANAIIMVVENDGHIVACSCLFLCWHQEGTWISPEMRGSVGVGRRLLTEMRSAIESVGAGEVWMMSTEPSNSALIQRFGSAVHMTADHFAVKVGA